MKLITAIVRGERLDDAMRALVNAGAQGMTTMEVRGFGQQFGHTGDPARAERAALLLPKFRVDVVVKDQQAQAVVDAIAKSVRTGAIGDGKIWTCAVDGALRVRTGDRDDDAI